jgi:prepilin-type N-terminal cleavage/methylation domain-containing protein
MTFKTKRYGFSLIEVMLAVSLTCVIALGALNYKYLSIKHSRATDAQLMAYRIAQLLIEDWKSTGGSADYDPVSLQLGFEAPTGKSDGNYNITLGNVPFFINIQQSDVETDNVAGVTLRQLTVTVKWRHDLISGAVKNYDPEITFNTYVRREQG